MANLAVLQEACFAYFGRNTFVCRFFRYADEYADEVSLARSPRRRAGPRELEGSKVEAGTFVTVEDAL
jgi:hypothetical protein